MGGTLTGRIALITGASRGIGAAVAQRFANEGAHVILVARTVGGLEAVDDAIQKAGGKATLVPMDLSDGNKIDQLGTQIAERYGKLDIVVGNAAMLGSLIPLAHMDVKFWDRIMAVNLTANWRLLRICDPLLRRSDAGRAMFVTSGVTEAAYPFWGAYSVTKTALEMLVNTYAAEVKDTNIRANLIDPGVVRTDMRASAMPGEDPQTLPEPSAVTDTFVKLAQASCTATGSKFSAQ